MVVPLPSSRCLAEGNRIFLSFLRTSSNPPPPNFSPPKKKPSNYSLGGTKPDLGVFYNLYCVNPLDQSSFPFLLNASLHVQDNLHEGLQV